MLTATPKRSTLGERPAVTPAPALYAGDETVTPGAHPVGRSHPATRAARRERDDVRSALPAHLLLLRDALADRDGRSRRTETSARTGTRPGAPRRPAPVRTGGAKQLTLSEWVSRTARIGTTDDGRAATR
ncbi:hypothetical protein [Streptomyces sp. PTD5-9]|uniref:hypothetical protein n=1 Tax=Streptomyces sp. PTD5-9 TaxID=3120150 RepID=UPI0030089373